MHLYALFADVYNPKHMQKYAIKYAEICNMHFPTNIDLQQYMQRYAKNMPKTCQKKYAKDVSMKFIGKICRNMHCPLY